MSRDLTIPDARDLAELQEILNRRLEEIGADLDQTLRVRDGVVDAGGARIANIGNPVRSTDAAPLHAAETRRATSSSRAAAQLGAQPAVNVDAPDHVTNIQLVGQTQVVIRGQVVNRMTFSYNAPPAGTERNNTFAGVRVTYFEADGGEFPKGDFEFTGDPGDEGVEFTVEHNAPFTQVTHTVRLVAFNPIADADVNTAPTFAFLAADKSNTAQPPTNVVLTIVDKPDDPSQYGLEGAWSKPVPQGGTIGYDLSIRSYQDEALTTPITPFRYPGTQDGYNTEAWFDGYWKKPAEVAEWVVLGVRGRGPYPDQAGGLSEWVYSAPKLLGDPSTVVTQPTSVTASIVGYRTDPAGEQWAQIRVQGTAGSNTDVIRVYSARGATQPAAEEFSDTNADNPHGTFYVTAGEAFSFDEFWARRPAGSSNETLWLAVVGNGQQLGVWFGPNAAAIVSVTLPARAMAPQITSATVTIESPSPVVAGVPSNRFTFTFSPTSDPEFWYCAIDRIRCDNTYTPLVGATYDGVPFGPDTSPHTQPEYWPLPPETEYWKWRFRAVNQAGEINNTDPVYVNMSVPGTSGFDPGGFNLAKLGDKLLVDEDGNLTAYALTELEKWGLGVDDFVVDGGVVKLKAAVIQRLLTASITLTGNMKIIHPDTNAEIELNASGISLKQGSNVVTITASGILLTGSSGATLSLTSTYATTPQLQTKDGTTVGATMTATLNQFQANTEWVGGATINFTNAGTITGFEISDVTGLWTELNGKANTSHTHGLTIPADLPTDGSATLGDAVNKINDILSVLRTL